MRIPQLVVDEAGAPVGDGGIVGMPPGPRGRLCWALGMADGPVLLSPAYLVVDAWAGALGDPAGILIGEPAARVHRMAAAYRLPWTRS